MRKDTGQQLITSQPHSPLLSGGYGPWWTLSLAQADCGGCRQGVKNQTGSGRSRTATGGECSGSPRSTGPSQSNITPVQGHPRRPVTPSRSVPTQASKCQGLGARLQSTAPHHMPWGMQPRETTKGTKKNHNMSV